MLIEAGATLNGALLEENLVDEWIIYMATCVLGDNGRGLFALPHQNSMADKKNLRLQEVRYVGADLRLTLIPSSVKWAADNFHAIFDLQTPLTQSRNRGGGC